jgi:hypothetical protein
MSATEFLRDITAVEIRKVSDDTDEAEDAARGRTMTGPEYINRMDVRLEQYYPELHQRIREFVEGQKEAGNPELFLIGVWAGATMFAHDITIMAEVHDARQQLSD